jgi:hypothetical protein
MMNDYIISLQSVPYFDTMFCIVILFSSKISSLINSMS